MSTASSTMRRPSRRLYLFAAVALAVFVFVLAASRMRSVEHQATALLTREVPSGKTGNSLRAIDASSNDLVKLREAVTNEKFLNQQINEFGWTRLHGDGEDFAADTPAARAHEIGPRFAFELLDGADDEPARVAVQFRAAEAETAREFVNLVSQAFAQAELAAAEAHQYRNPYKEAKQAALNAKQDWDIVQYELDSYVEEHQAAVRQIRQQVPTSDEPTPPETPIPVESGPALSGPSLVGDRYADIPAETAAPAQDEFVTIAQGQEPQAPPANTPVLSEADLAAKRHLDKLAADLVEMQRIKQEMTAKLTPSHPMLMELNRRLSDLSIQRHALLSNYPALAVPAPPQKPVSEPPINFSGQPTDNTLAVNNGVTPPPLEQQATVAAETPVEEIEISDTERAQLLAEVERRERRVETAAAEYQRRSQIERDRWMKQLDEMRVPRWTVVTADQASLHHEPTSISMVMIAAALAIAAGISLVVASGASTAGIETVDEAAAVLPVPVVGALPAKTQRAGRPQPRRFVRVVTLCCEIGLTVFLLMTVLAVMLDGEFAASLRKDPLAAFSDSLRRMLTIFQR